MLVNKGDPLEPPSVLIVDDTPANLFVLQAVLGPLGARLVEARSGAEAIDLVAKQEFAVALLDVQMPDLDGFETAAKMRMMANGSELPIIFLTAIHRDESYAKRGYAAGAADYVIKPFDADIVRARVKAFVDLFEQREEVRRAQVALRTRERDEAIRRLVAFERIASAALDSAQLPELLKELLGIFLSAADAADAACILLREGDTLHMRAMVGIDDGPVEEALSMSVGEGFPGTIAQRRAPLELSDAAGSALVRSTWLRARGTKGLYGVPMFVEGEVIGVAQIGSRSSETFSEVEKRVFAAMTERAASAVAAQVKRSRLHDVLMAAPAMISIVRVPAMTIELANPFFRGLFRGRELVGRHLRETGLDDAAQGVIERAYRTGETIAHEELAVKGEFAAGGVIEERIFRLTAQPLRNAVGVVDSVLVFAFDVTAHVEARRAIEAHEAERTALLASETAARAAAERASQAKDSFLATVSHELRTPLNAILGWTVVARASAPPEMQRALSIVERNARAQAKLIEDVLDVSRIASGKLRIERRSADLGSIVTSVVDALRPDGDARGVHIELHLVDLPPLQLDADRIAQVVWNLVSNAIKFTPTGGRVVIQSSAADGRAVLVVADDGQGIEPAFLPHVFEPFRQADGTTTRRHQGLGLGLSIVRELVEAHDGTIAVSSEGKGRGATFEVRLPIAPGSGGPEEGARSPSSGPLPPLPLESQAVRLDGLRVLIVEDDEDARALLAETLGRRGAVTAGAESVASGLVELARFKPDVIVSDIAMPDGDGYALMRAVRELSPEEGGRTPAIALTAHARPSDSELAFEAGFQRYAAKPVEVDRLAIAIASLAITAPKGA